MEIERKWLLPKDFIINVDIFKSVFTRQFYIGGIRLRHTKYTNGDADKYYINVKGPGNLSREEWEEEIPQWAFDQIALDKNHSSEIVKTVHKSRLEELVLEFHIFHGKFKGLTILECEFPDEATAQAFELPEHINAQVIKEVTDDLNYQNQTLAQKGWPIELVEKPDIPCFND